jgi:hypothetical protein
MKVTIEINSENDMEMLSALLEKFNMSSVEVIHTEQKPSVTKGNKEIDPNSLFGIWAAAPRTLAGIRKASWERTPLIK